jgi:hypothetical protein
MVGYVFTECDQDVGAFILDSKKSGEIQDSYVNMQERYTPLDWDWNELL